MIPVLTSFLPPTHTHLYLPTLFSLWEAFNSNVIDDRLLDLAGTLSEEYVAGAQGDAGDEGSAQRKDIGMWTESQWDLLVGKGLQSMSNFTPRLVTASIYTYYRGPSRDITGSTSLSTIIIIFYSYIPPPYRVLLPPLAMLMLWLIMVSFGSRNPSIVIVGPYEIPLRSFLNVCC